MAVAEDTGKGLTELQQRVQLRRAVIASSVGSIIVPSYDQIGIWGAVILTMLRFVQGVGVGGEWAGAVLLPMEWARTNAHRGFITSWPQFGAPAGLFLANLAVLAFSALSGDQFLSWGWRVPFWASIGYQPNPRRQLFVSRVRNQAGHARAARLRSWEPCS